MADGGAAEYKEEAVPAAVVSGLLGIGSPFTIVYCIPQLLASISTDVLGSSQDLPENLIFNCRGIVHSLAIWA